MKLLCLVVILFLSSCGKNENFIPVGNFPHPPTVSSPYSPGPYFYPQMPNGYPPQYYPYLPVHNYFNQNPMLSGYWQQYWNNWVNYCGYYQCNPYNFSLFWYDYCPRQWRNTDMWNLYLFLDSNFYYWMQPDTVFIELEDPSVFWQNYYGYSYYCDFCY